MIKTDYVNSTLSVKAQQYLQQQAQPIPKFPCMTCAKLNSDGKCDCFKRPVDAEKNKCFNHSSYNPIKAEFKAPNNIEEIAKENEEKSLCLVV